MVSYFSALDSSGVLLLYTLMSLASPMTFVLISTPKHTYLYVCRARETRAEQEEVHRCAGAVFAGWTRVA